MRQQIWYGTSAGVALALAISGCSTPTTTVSPGVSSPPTISPTTISPTTSSPTTLSPTTLSPTTAAPPAPAATDWAGRNDFGYAKAVLRTTGGPCLSVDRLAELRGAKASAWVAKHPGDASDNDLPVIGDVDGPRLICLPLTSHVSIRLSTSPHGLSIGLRAATLDQLRRLLADPGPDGYGSGAPTWFIDVMFYRWHYDKAGRVDSVTAFWTP